MFRFWSTGLALVVAFAVVGCNVLQQHNVFEYYDACAVETKSFVTMAECGKKTRNEKCVETNSCSTLGNAAVQYADALSESVERGEVSDSDARLRWIKFKVEQIDHMQNITAASAPVTCVSGSYSMTCY
jgi:hypothetical protein